MTPTPIERLRSVAFNLTYLCGSLLMSILLLWTLVLPRRACVVIVSAAYGGFIALAEKYIMGLTFEIRGMEHVPADGRFVIAAKHQSAFETLKLPYMRALGYPVIVLKRELLWLPVWGLYPLKMGLVPIDRGSGTAAMNSISRGCKRALGEGRSVAIFPQGTRVAVDKKVDYKIGIAKIYRDLDVPLVPMALNSGVFWGRNAFFKKSGRIVFEFLPPIAPGEPPLKVMERLESVIENATDRLVAEAKAARNR